MKKVYNIILSVVALLLFAPVVNAQEYAQEELNKQIYYSDAGGLCYSKSISKPQADGTYWITLESFVTGELTGTAGGDKPVDLVLVLDVSSSMAQYRGSTPVSYSGSISYNDIMPDLTNYDIQNPKTNYLIRYNNSYCQLFGEKDGDNYYLCFYSVGSNTKRYITSNGTSSQKSNAVAATTPGGAIINNRNDIYTGSSRIRDLQNAVIAFIDEVYDNAVYKKNSDGTKTERVPHLQNAVSIVTFADSPNTVQELTVLTADNLMTVKEKVNSFVLHTGTNGGQGITTANTIFNNIKASNSTRYNSATRSVVFFTDGEQNDQWAAIGQAYTSKTTHTATVYTVGLFGSSVSDTNKRNMEYTSSNYPQAQSASNPGTKITLEEGEDGFYFDASNDDVNLSSVFVSIAASSSGGSDGDWGETTLSQVDVVSADFTLPSVPEGENIADKIKVFVAPFNGEYVKNSSGQIETYTVTIKGVQYTRNYLKFGTKETVAECLASTAHDPIETSQDDDGNTILPTVTVNGNTVSINGYDYGANWCGTSTIDDVVTYHGHKLIVLIPIKMSSQSTGGPGTKTNGPGSGIFAVDENGNKTSIVPFVSPVVNLPVNIRINKQGLQKGESAKFLIQSSTTPTVESSWQHVTSVFVTRHENEDENAALTSVIGLPATDKNNNVIVYRIVEEKWGWSYYPTTYTHKLNDGRVYLLTTDQVFNPFIFHNNQKDNIDVKVRHAESLVKNVFKGTTSNPETTDSKTNTN